MAPQPTPNGSRAPGHNFRRTSKQSSPRILHTLQVLTAESSSIVGKPVTRQHNHEYPPRNGQTRKKVRSSANTKWRPGPWSQFSAHVKTKHTSPFSRVLGPYHKVLIHLRLHYDTALPSETPDDSRAKTRKYHSCFRFWQRASWIAFLKAGLRSVSHLHLSGSAS